jgi:hypothetical protein
VFVAVRSVRALTIAIFSAALFGQPSDINRAPDAVPEEWLQVRHQPWVDWFIGVSPAILDYQQRMRAIIRTTLNGDEIERRLDDSELDLFVVVRDAAGHSYSFERRMDLTTMKVPAGGEEFSWNTQQLDWSLPVYFLPGDYRIFLVLYDTTTKEHSLQKTRLRVPRLSHDPLPEAWSHVPPVEFAPLYGQHGEKPDRWRLPSLAGRLNLPVAPARRIGIDVVVNVDPSLWDVRGKKSLGENLSVLLPELNVVSQMSPGDGSLNVVLLDLARQRVLVEQNEVRNLDWLAIRRALELDDPNKIEAQELEKTGSMARFFSAQIYRRLLLSAPRVVIVLSAPLRIERGQPPQPAELSASPGAHVFYVRYSSPWGRPAVEASFPGEVEIVGVTPPVVELRDQLEPTLKPLVPRVLDVESPQEFRKALATMLSTIKGL